MKVAALERPLPQVQVVVEPYPRVLLLGQETLQLVVLIPTVDGGEVAVVLPAELQSVGPGLRLPHKLVVSGGGSSACSAQPWKAEGTLVARR